MWKWANINTSGRRAFVFQGNNLHVTSGTDATDLLEAVSNTPARFLSPRCALNAAALCERAATLRDADQAYMQAHIDGSGRVPT